MPYQVSVDLCHPNSRIDSAEPALTTAISRTNSSRCCSKTVGEAVRRPEPGVEEDQAMAEIVSQKI